MSAYETRWMRREDRHGIGRDRPLIIAHRGTSSALLENTLPAFALAERQGADGIELDVMRCATGEVVVFHDDTLERLAGAPEAIRRLPLAALRSIELADPTHPLHRGRIPTLDEVFDSAGEKLLVNVELKSTERHGIRQIGVLLDDGLPAAVARLIARRSVASRVLVSSFDPLLLYRFMRLAPTVSTALLFHGDLRAPLRDAWASPLIRPIALHPQLKMVTAARVAQWHARGKLVNVWTVDEPHELAYLAAIGVDGVITNRPEIARAVFHPEAVAATTASRKSPSPTTTPADTGTTAAGGAAPLQAPEDGTASP